MAAPAENQNRVKGKRWQQAIDRALANRSRAAGIEALDVLAEKLLALADAGDLQALKELGDRLDGRAAQSLDIGNKDGEPFTVVERKVVDTKHPNS